MASFRSRFVALCLLLFGAFVPDVISQSLSKLEDPPWVKDVASKRIVYSVPGMERVEVRRDLVYKRAADFALKADVYSPPRHKRGTPQPAVIFIHGGSLPPNLLTKPKDWGVYRSYGQLIAASGFVGITFNHRYHGYDFLDEAQSDVDDLIAYVRNRADALGVDKERIFIWAFSAGGIFLSHALRAAPPYIRGIIAYYALLDLRPRRKEVPASVSDEALQEFSPLYHVSSSGKMLPPMFVARAGRDDADLNRALDRFVQEATAKSANLDFSNHATGRHGFDIFNDDARSREIIKRTVDFIKLKD
jgi:acetyl esterase/lipase